MLSMKERGALGAKAKYLKYSIKKTNEVNYNLNPSLCQQCQNILTYTQRKQKFCSRSCAITLNNERRRTKRFCLQCKNLILGKGKLYCSLKCYRIYQLNFTPEALKNGTITSPSGVRKAFRKITKYVCSLCQISSWNNKSLVLQIDHIDGNYFNNKLENLRFLCPNCHSQTDTFGIKNKGKGRHKRRERYAQGKSN